MNQVSNRVRTLVAMALVIAVFLVAYKAVERKKQNLPSAGRTDVSVEAGTSADLRQVPVEEALEASRASGAMPSAGRSSKRSGSDAAGENEGTAHARRLVAQLSGIDTTKGVISPEQAEKWKLGLNELASQGSAAVPAIRQFLEKNQDINFAVIRGGVMLGQSSIRMALLSVLKQIGGSEARDVMVQTIQATAIPSEVALLGNYLEEQAPGQYRQQAVSAAKEVFAMAAQGQLPGWDIGALLEMVRNFDSASAQSTAEKLRHEYPCYAAMALANVEGGAGVPALLRQSPVPGEAGASADGNFALQMLAQVAALNPEASSALLQQARQGQIPESAWPKIAMGLGGDQFAMFSFTADGRPDVPSVPGLKTYHVEAGNQNFYSVPASVIASPEQVSARFNLIDQLIATKPGPAAVQALRDAREKLSANVASK